MITITNTYELQNEMTVEIKARLGQRNSFIFIPDSYIHLKDALYTYQATSI